MHKNSESLIFFLTNLFVLVFILAVVVVVGLSQYFRPFYEAYPRRNPLPRDSVQEARHRELQAGGGGARGTGVHATGVCVYCVCVCVCCACCVCIGYVLCVLCMCCVYCVFVYYYVLLVHVCLSICVMCVSCV